LVTGGAIAAAYVYAPRNRRDIIQGAATVVALLLFAALIWWRTTELRAQLGL
ncbi:MAG: hypothetical protein QOF15_928, partial [Mycobacterium sp.]|nr:hypothetical protein [Mycobacterium sp.]